MDTPPRENLQDILSQGNKALKKASYKLGQLQSILDCQGVERLTTQQLNLLFLHIPKDLKEQVHKYIDVKTLEPTLSTQVSQYLFEPSRPRQKWIKPLIITLGSLVALTPIAYLGWKYFQFSLGYQVTENLFTLGTISEVKNYQPLEEYLEKKLVINDYWRFLKGEKIKVSINGDRKLKYQEAKTRMANKEWDISFTLSPMNSIAARDNGYIFVARMFPDRPPFYQSAFFVKADSNIKSLNDLKPSTVIAMGEIGSASSFFMPAYDLYGKILTVKSDNRGQDIVEMVKTGKADIGAGAYGDTVKNDPEIRIIQISCNIPSSGIYLSPTLVELDRQSITKALLNAPKVIQEKANYGQGEEPDYSNFLEIVRRVETVLSCSDFEKNLVKFFCSEAQNSQNVLDKVESTIIFGTVNGYRFLSNETIALICTRSR